MRYKLKNGIIIRTENAAKTTSQPSKHLLRIMEQLPKASSSFDFGCGKLRYMRHIMLSTDSLLLVDSEIQLSREQTLEGYKTNIRSLLQSSNRVSVANPAQFHALSERFDRGFCINVLSSIPFHAIRMRVIKSINRALIPGGTCIFVAQYRNSDFNRMLKMPNATAWRDGILVNSLRGHSFYALIRPETLTKWITESGLEVINLDLHDGSVYLIARRPMPTFPVHSNIVQEEATMRE